ncbi:unnamed protein product [Ilex paraguariensis]|uniref:Protein kinase domain-containing protein n=1 Tax=Ilex paraguariensis TaxID=185542 RepID=A0ABC8TTK6_9AQUA
MAESIAENNRKDGLVFFGKGERVYGLDKLLTSKIEFLGKGTFGSTYKSFLDDGVVVAVKILKFDYVLGVEREKIEKLGERVHENLLPLRAYHCTNHGTVLIYDYIPMGSLSALLHGNGGASKTQLGWEVRCRIAYGVAQGIEYLHSRGPDVCHGNIRSSNIILNDNYDAHLSDFGIDQLILPHSKANLIAGYQAPELKNSKKISQKSDIYSFGVLLLELLTGKVPIDALSKNEGVDLPKCVRLMFQEKPVIDVFDSDLLRYKNVGEQMVLMLQLAICCTFENPNKRPSIDAVTNRIKEINSFTRIIRKLYY